MVNCDLSRYRIMASYILMVIGDHSTRWLCISTTMPQEILLPDRNNGEVSVSHITYLQELAKALPEVNIAMLVTHIML